MPSLVSPRVKTYAVMQMAVDEGVAAGVRHAFKHTDHPPPDTIIVQIATDVLNSICDWFEFDDEE